MIDSKFQHLKLRFLNEEFSYYLFEDKLKLNEACNDLTSKGIDHLSFSFAGEYSLISLKGVVKECSREEQGWSAFKIEGEMPFGTVQGLISLISSSLIRNQVGVCVISTFKTDLFLVRDKNINLAKEALSANGWEIV